MKWFYILLCFFLGGCQVSDKPHGLKRESIAVLRDHMIEGVPFSQYINERAAYLVSGEHIAGLAFDASGRLNVLSGDEAAAAIQTGSAAAITEDGYFLTAAHVIASSEDSDVWLVHRWEPRRLNGKARVVWISREWDLALLKAEMRTQYYSFGDPYRNKYFRIIIAGLDGGNSSGSIASVEPMPSEDGVLQLIHNAPIRPGDSGGALISSKGKLLGINTGFRRSVHGYGIELERGYAVSIEPGIIFEKINSDRLLGN